MAREIPDRWLNQVRHYIQKTSGEERDHLRAYDFPSTRSVRVEFQDGSFAFFRYAFYLGDEGLGEVAIFTEHCGYYFVSSVELLVETFETVRYEASKDQGG